MGISALIITLALAIHRVFVIRKGFLSMYSFKTKRKAMVDSFSSYFELTSRALYAIALNRQGRISFVGKYGFDIYNFLNFQTKFAIVILAQSLLVIIAAMFFLINNQYGVSFGDFLIGKMDFENFAFFFTLITLPFSFMIYSAIFLLRRETKQIHMHFLLRKKEIDSKYCVLPYVVFLSEIPTGTTKASLQADLASILDCKLNDMEIVLFPRMSKLVNLQIEMEELRDKHAHKMKHYYWFYKIFRSKNKYDMMVTKKLEKMEEEYKIRNSKPLVYNGNALVCFYKLDQIQNFYYIHRDFQSQKQKESKIRSELKEKLLSKALGSTVEIKKSFLIGSSDIILKNIDLHAPSYYGVRVILYSGLILIIIFISTPATIIQGFSNLFINNIISSQSNSAFNSGFGKFFLTFFNPLITFLLNFLMIFFINVVGKWQKFSKHSSYQVFVLRMAFSYLIVNMFVLPGFSLGTAKSIFELFVNGQFSIIEIFNNLRFYETGTFYSIFLMQAGSFQFMNSLLIPYIWITSGFSYKAGIDYLKSIRKSAYKKRETDIFEFGYFHSYDCVILYIIVVFGVYQPLIIFTGVFYFAIKSMGTATWLTLYTKDQLYSKNKLLDLTLNRVKFAVVMSYFVLALKCYATGKIFGMIVNTILLLVAITLAIILRKKAFTLRYLFEFKRKTNFGREVY